MACNFCDALLAGAVGPLHCQMTAENGTQFCTLCSVLREMLHASSRENKNWPGPARSTATTKPPAVVVSYTASSGIVHTATFFCQLLLQPSIVPLDAVQDVVSQPPRVCWLWLQQFRYPTAVSTVAIFASTCCTTYANLHSAAHQSLIRCINCSRAPCSQPGHLLEVAVQQGAPRRWHDCWRSSLPASTATSARTPWVFHCWTTTAYSRCGTSSDSIFHASRIPLECVCSPKRITDRRAALSFRPTDVHVAQRLCSRSTATWPPPFQVTMLCCHVNNHWLSVVVDKRVTRR